MDLGLKQEQIVFENNRFYEAIYVSQNSTQPISATGGSMWDRSNTDHQQYWQKTLDHYRKKAAADPVAFGPIVADYEALLITGYYITSYQLRAINYRVRIEPRNYSTAQVL